MIDGIENRPLLVDVGLKFERADDWMDAHQTDTACSWLVCRSREDCKLYPATPPLRRPATQVIGEATTVRPRSMAGGAPTPCGRH